ncbi:uncharacterized protein F5Z01DRAFT_653171 [Emericellopsis atlantica]|uniref:Uncharacterized protein n=1 Tax=Emericellopsis atlantica TaxID=2614577 RepID=A0A9P7ZPT5_9HYPO|nr:uncharacterized protein F5Z01DRAFT_653171 [Emericellopsis atlantica]KAG9255468.1 hypothetical protein F5Z01DRAFT_653171 [Emericellopsis atlantica]
MQPVLFSWITLSAIGLGNLHHSRWTSNSPSLPLARLVSLDRYSMLDGLLGCCRRRLFIDKRPFAGLHPRRHPYNACVHCCGHVRSHQAKPTRSRPSSCNQCVHGPLSDDSLTVFHHPFTRGLLVLPTRLCGHSRTSRGNGQ